jgi:hypothetical protein
MTQSQNWLWTHLKNSIGVLFLVAAAHTVEAQDTPYFVTYDHHLEEAGTLEIERFTTMGFPQGPEASDPAERGQRFYAAPYVEIEYAVHDQWTTAFCLQILEERFLELATSRWDVVSPEHLFGSSIRTVTLIQAARIDLSREELAQMTGTTLFTVSRLLSKWGDQGILQAQRKSVLVLDRVAWSNSRRKAKWSSKNHDVQPRAPAFDTYHPACKSPFPGNAFVYNRSDYNGN